MTSSTSTVVSIDYVDANFQGPTLTWIANGLFSCSGFPDFTENSMPAGWNDVISSYQDFANCNINVHYENVNLNAPHDNGNLVNCGPSCAYVGDAMNDKTSSEQWGFANGPVAIPSALASLSCSSRDAGRERIRRTGMSEDRCALFAA
jgi:hypothetical protein